MSKTLASFLFSLVFLLNQGFAQSSSDGGSAGQSGISTGGGAPLVSDNYVLQPRDILQFRIMGEPEYNLEIRVSSDGTVILPLLNTVKLGGMTVNEARERLYNLYNADYFVEPQIQILLLQYAEKRVEVIGQVNRPGTILIPPEQNLTLVTAISAAGGTTRLANDRAVRLTRTLANGQKQTTEHNVQDILRDPNQKDVPIMEGDFIYVPERRF